jgi:hypothetical protein
MKGCEFTSSWEGLDAVQDQEAAAIEVLIGTPRSVYFFLAAYSAVRN